MPDDGDDGLVTFKRWRRVINGSFQYRTIATYLSVVLAGSILFFAALVMYHWVASLSGGASLGERLKTFLPVLLANAAAIMVFVIVVGLSASHRIAGPIFRICRDIDRVLAGEKKIRVHLRQGDAFPELAEKVNQLIERIDETAKG